MHVHPRPVLRRTQRHGIVLLLATVLLLIMPSAEPYPVGGAVVALLFLLTIAAGMAAMPGHGGHRIALLALPFEQTSRLLQTLPADASARAQLAPPKPPPITMIRAAA